MGIMAKLKKLQKERLIVARLGFPDKAMEIDEHIEKIRADLRSEREKVDSRILEEELAALAIQHREKLASLEQELKEDEQKVSRSFERERAVLLRKQEKQFVQLVDDAIKRAIGKSKSCSCSKKYLCHHNKTASFNTRRPKKEVIHFRKNAKRLRHGGRLDESAAWEEKAAELDANHLDSWREEVAASLTASAWGGSSSALDQQLATEHQREISRMETAQANGWTLMLMRHQTARRNCHNVIMVERKKASRGERSAASLRHACKKSAEERHRREMLGEADPTEGGAAPSGATDEASCFHPHYCGIRFDVEGMLRNVIEDEGSATGEAEGKEAQPSGGTAAGRPPTRPSSAPPARGKRPQPAAATTKNINQHVSETVAASPSATEKAGEGENVGAADEGVHVDDDDSFGKDSHDLRGFDELEGEAWKKFSYDDYPAAGSPEEPEWIHTPWCGTNSGDIPVLDKVSDKKVLDSDGTPMVQFVLPASAASAPPSSASSAGRVDSNTATQPMVRGGGASEGFGDGEDKGVIAEHKRDVGSPRSGAEGDADKGRPCSATGELFTGDAAPAISPLGFAGEGAERDSQGDGGGSGRSPGSVGDSFTSPRALAGGGELRRYNWLGADAAPTKPSLLATSRIPTGNRAAKQRFRNAKRQDANRKTVSWGENMEVPPESPDDDDANGDGTETDEGSAFATDGGGRRSNTAPNALDEIADGFVDDDAFSSSNDDDDDDDDQRHPENNVLAAAAGVETAEGTVRAATASTVPRRAGWGGLEVGGGKEKGGYRERGGSTASVYAANASLRLFWK
ncbi:unnamed protein product [Ectocarpus sp. 6 AP-2014]